MYAFASSLAFIVRFNLMHVHIKLIIGAGNRHLNDLVRILTTVSRIY